MTGIAEGNLSQIWSIIMSENTTSMLKDMYTTVTTENPTDEQLDRLNNAFHNLHVRDALILQAMRHDIPFNYFTAMVEHPDDSMLQPLLTSMFEQGQYTEAYARGFLTLLGKAAGRPNAGAQTFAVQAFIHWFLHEDDAIMDSLMKASELDSDCSMAQLVFTGVMRGVYPSRPTM